MDLPRTDVDVPARLISEPDDLQVLTFARCADAKTAMAMALEEYLKGVSIVWLGGRLLRFAETKHVWSEWEEPSKRPALVIRSTGELRYDTANFTPSTVRVGAADAKDEPAVYLREACGIIQDFALEVWSHDPTERAGLCAALEDAVQPVDWMNGFRLEIPRYFNARATYEVLGLTYDDSDEQAKQRRRNATFQVTANMTQYRPLGRLPRMKARARVEVEE